MKVKIESATIEVEKVVITINGVDYHITENAGLSITKVAEKANDDILLISPKSSNSITIG